MAPERRSPAESAAWDSPVERAARALLAMQRSSWEQGVAAQAFLEIGCVEEAVLMAEDAVLHQAPDGRPAVLPGDRGATDPAAIGEILLWTAKRTGAPGLSCAVDRLLEYLLRRAPRADDGTPYHTLDAREVWIDSMYMAPPFLAAAGRTAEALDQVEGIRRRLWDSEARLYSHRWDDGAGRFIRREHWGAGNGWAAAAFARIVDLLPESALGERERIAGYGREVIDGCLAHRRSDGRFHDIVDDPASFVETNLSQMIAYAIFRGLASGWLPEEYRSEALILRTAARSSVDELGFVRDVCGAPDFESPGRAAEAQAFFLLMEAAFAGSAAEGRGGAG